MNLERAQSKASVTRCSALRPLACHTIGTERQVFLQGGRFFSGDLLHVMALMETLFMPCSMGMQTASVRGVCYKVLPIYAFGGPPLRVGRRRKKCTVRMM